MSMLVIKIKFISYGGFNLIKFKKINFQYQNNKKKKLKNRK